MAAGFKDTGKSSTFSARLRIKEELFILADAAGER